VLAAEGVTGLSAQVLDHRGVEQLSGVAVVSDVLRVSPRDDAITLRLQRDGRAFFQGNRFLLEPLVQHVAALVPDGPIVDLYAGVGLFGLSRAAAGSGGRSRSSKRSDQRPRSSGERGAVRGRARVERSSVEDFVARLSPGGDATFIVDPPRTGISKEALGEIIRARPKRLVYVFMRRRDACPRLPHAVDAAYSLDGVTGFDLFPNTAHVETVCTFHRP